MRTQLALAQQRADFVKALGELENLGLTSLSSTNLEVARSLTSLAELATQLKTSSAAA